MAIEITEESCSADYQAKLRALVTSSPKAKDLADFSLGLAYQKLAYAHHEYESSKNNEDRKAEIEANLDAYLSNNGSSPNKEEVLKLVGHFNKSMIDSETTLDQDNVKYLEALSIYSQALKPKFRIKDHEKTMLSKFGNVSGGKLQSSWKIFIGDIANNFHRRRFKDNQENRVYKDRDVVVSKFDGYSNGVKASLGALAEDLSKTSLTILNGCEDFVKFEQTDNGKLCNIFDPFRLDDASLLENTSNALELMYNTAIRDMGTATPVRYAGPTVQVTKCSMTANEDGTWNIVIPSKLSNIPSNEKGGKESEWTAKLEGAHSFNIDNTADENGFTFLSSDKEIKFNNVSLDPEKVNSPLKLDFVSNRGNEMLFNENAELGFKKTGKSGNTTSFEISCNPPKPPEEKTPETPASLVASKSDIKPDLTVDITYTGSNLGDSNKKIEVSVVDSTGKELNKISLLLGDDLKAMHNVAALESFTYKAKVIDTPEAKAELQLNDKLEISINESPGSDKSTITATVKPEIPGFDGENITWYCTGNDSDEQERAQEIEEAAEDNSSEAREEATDKSCGKGGSLEVSYDDLSKPNITASLISGSKVIESNKITIVKPQPPQTEISVAITPTETEDKTTLKASVTGVTDEQLKTGKITWSCTENTSCASTTDTQEVARGTKPVAVTATFTLGDKEYKSSPATVKAKEKPKSEPKDDDGDDDDDDDDDEEEECTQEDAFSPKVCKPKGEKEALPKRYMPPLQQPMVLPNAQPYMTPAFN
jgi:hypothetical protein